MKPIYLIQEHHATKLHYDLRLQVNSVLFSWAVPKNISDEVGVKRLAIRTDDHALSWATFEGRITEGYGKGTVKIWDKGHYIPLEIKSGKMVFKIKGKKRKGIWSLSKMKGEESKWILEKIGGLSD
jgi:DNA ligase D-like protein (predicted 3'-phosphoesterase)